MTAYLLDVDGNPAAAAARMKHLGLARLWPRQYLVKLLLKPRWYYPIDAIAASADYPAEV